jgi:transposase-like protein
MCTSCHLGYHRAHKTWAELRSVKQPKKKLSSRSLLKRMSEIGRWTFLDRHYWAFLDRQWQLWNYKAFPRAHWRKIRTTNGLERIRKELKRRTRVAGAFSNDESLLRLAVSIMMNINEEWITGNRYLSMEEWSYHEYKANEKITAILAHYRNCRKQLGSQ